MDLNKWVNARTNDVAPGNENMRGNSLLDEATDPAMLNHIIGTIGGGAATFMTRGTGLVLKYADGREQEIETKDIPFLRSLMYTPSEQTSMARTKAKWYSYKESMEKNMSNYSMLKNKNVPLTERIRNAADRHRFEQSADYARIRIIKDAEKTTLQLKEHSMTFDNRLPADIQVKGNQSLLYSVFRNLTDNAIAYAGEGSTITLSAEKTSQQEWRFTFSDNGVGVPNEHLARLFARWSTLAK